MNKLQRVSDKLQQLNDERRFLISARHVFLAAERLEAAKVALAEAQREVDRRCSQLVDELGPMELPLAVGELESMGLPLTLELDGFRLEVADNWYEYAPAKKREAVSVEPIVPGKAKDVSLELARVDREITQVHQAAGDAQAWWVPPGAQ